MADEKVRMTRFDAWFLRAMWIGLLSVLLALIVWLASMAISIAMAGGPTAGRAAGLLLALAAALVVTLVWAAMRTPRQWRWISARAASDAPHVVVRKYQMIEWLKKVWQETDPVKDAVPSAAELPDDDLRSAGLDNDAIKRLKDNPRGFPHTLRRLGHDFGRVRGKGFAERTVGAAHYIWSRCLA